MIFFLFSACDFSNKFSEILSKTNQKSDFKNVNYSIVFESQQFRSMYTNKLSNSVVKEINSPNELSKYGINIEKINELMIKQKVVLILEYVGALQYELKINTVSLDNKGDLFIHYEISMESLAPGSRSSPAMKWIAFVVALPFNSGETYFKKNVRL